MFVGGKTSIPPQDPPLKNLSKKKYAAIFDLAEIEKFAPILNDIQINLELYDQILTCDNPIKI